jgi:hypothetical protein
MVYPLLPPPFSKELKMEENLPAGILPLQNVFFNMG